MFGLTAAPDVAIAMPKLKPLSSLSSRAYKAVSQYPGTSALDTPSGAVRCPVTALSEYPQGEGAEYESAALRSCHARFVPCVRFNATLIRCSGRCVGPPLDTVRKTSQWQIVGLVEAGKRVRLALGDCSRRGSNAPAEACTCCAARTC